MNRIQMERIIREQQCIATELANQRLASERSQLRGSKVPLASFLLSFF